MSEGAPSPPSSPGPSSSQHTDQEMRGRGKDEERGRGKGSKGKDGEKEVVALQVKFLFCKKTFKTKTRKEVFIPFHLLLKRNGKWEKQTRNCLFYTCCQFCSDWGIFGKAQLKTRKRIF